MEINDNCFKPVLRLIFSSGRGKYYFSGFSGLNRAREGKKWYFKKLSSSSNTEWSINLSELNEKIEQGILKSEWKFYTLEQEKRDKENTNRKVSG